ncbi:MAG: nicotinate (nicotinamide) nucleotide adenylyltransferase [Chlamydiia bacterium]|nr:nicotinate (nicotinamide) nucleotide adenylyltransferase [Chlamydiia bacterium]
MKKIGFFGGSFDPIHLGHLNLALRIMELKGLDQVLFCPAHISPTKGEAPPIAPPNHRLNMLQLALEDVPGCDPYDGEIERPPPSYTVDTLIGLKGELYLIVAEDTAYGFGAWKEIEKVLEMAPPLIGTRYGFDKKKLSTLPETIRLKVEEGMCQIPAMDISSTEVRERLKKRLYCGHLVQGKVLDYIHQNTIYSPLYG